VTSVIMTSAAAAAFLLEKLIKKNLGSEKFGQLELSLFCFLFEEKS
jgi:hypothetical protein